MFIGCVISHIDREGSHNEMAMASAAPRLYEPSTLLEIQALFVARETLLFQGKTAAYELLAAHEFRYMKIRLSERRDSLCGYVRTKGNKELQQEDLLKGKWKEYYLRTYAAAK